MLKYALAIGAVIALVFSGAVGVAATATTNMLNTPNTLDTVDSTVTTLTPPTNSDTLTSPVSTTSSTLSNLAPSSNRKKKEFDRQVTDIQMRAESGSQKKFSSSYIFHYHGSAIDDMGATTRPLIGGQRLAAPVSLDGDIGLRYRFNQNDSLFVAVGLYQADPLHTSSRSQPMTFNTPEISFNSTRRIGGVELSNSTVASFTTIPYLLKVHDLGRVSEFMSVLKPIGYSRFDVGTWADASFTAYGDERVPANVARKQNDFGFQVSPSIDYRPFRKVKIWTSFAVINQLHFRSNPGVTHFAQQAPSGNLGFGFAVKRNIYFDPFIQYAPTQLALNKTIFNLSSNINF